jgi:hypothetical protein
MFNANEVFSRGSNNTVQINNTGFSYNNSWQQIYEKTLIERWYLGDFSGADYTITVDLNANNKEIVKCLVVATVDDASLVVYARNNTNIDLVELSAIVNETYLELYISPKDVKVNGAKFFYTGNYFVNQTPLNL